MFTEPLAVFARALFSLRSAFDATAARGGAAGLCLRSQCKSRGHRATPTGRLPLTDHCPDVFSVLVLVERTIAAQCPCLVDQAQQLFCDYPIFRSSLQQLELLSGQRSLVPQLTYLGLSAEQGSSVHRETSRVAALQTRAGVPAQMVDFFVGHSKA